LFAVSRESGARRFRFRGERLSGLSQRRLGGGFRRLRAGCLFGVQFAQKFRLFGIDFAAGLIERSLVGRDFGIGGMEALLGCLACAFR